MTSAAGPGTTGSASPASATPAGDRLRLTAYAAEQVALVVPALLLVNLLVVAGVLAVIWVGIPLLFVAVPATRALATRQRTVCARVLGTPLPSPYQEPSGNRVVSWARDPMTWRDAGWLLFTVTLGFALSLLAVLLLVLVVTGVLWWYGVEPIMRGRCAIDRWLLSYGHTEQLEQRVQVLTETRTESIDHSAAELRRIERDLHDGAQARLVALSMTLGLADRMLPDDPAAAQRLVAEARTTTGAALADLRGVVRGIHPPVLADRGLTGAVESLALDMAIPVAVGAHLGGRPPAPVESAVYFAVAECLANIGKHSGAAHGWVELGHTDGVLRAVVGDDGRGGADADRGTGMRGVMRRLASFDGTMRVSSPPQGPTIVTLEVPCALSSPKTTPSSETA